MASDFVIKEGKLKPVLQATLKDATNTGIDLSAASTVTFSMRALRSTTKTVDAGACTVVTAASGIVKYSWTSGDTDPIGQYEGEFTITWNDATVEIVPNDETADAYISIRIQDAI